MTNNNAEEHVPVVGGDMIVITVSWKNHLNQTKQQYSTNVPGLCIAQCAISDGLIVGMSMQ